MFRKVAVAGVALTMGCAATGDLARSDCPSHLPTLVDATSVSPGIQTEIRYATHDNFTGAPLPGHESPRALLRPAPADALAEVQASLEARGHGLKVWDAYRPVRATLAMVDWAESSDNEWVLDEGYVARRSGHNTGGTIDLTVIELDSGEELDMGTPYDEFSERSHTMNASGEVMRNRRILLDAMEAAGFENYAMEWWHFTYAGDHEPLDIALHCF